MHSVLTGKFWISALTIAVVAIIFGAAIGLGVRAYDYVVGTSCECK